MIFNKLFDPKSIAVIGVSRNKKKVGYGVLRNLVSGCTFRCKFCRPFKGKIYPVNPNAKKILGLHCYKSVLDIKQGVDLAVIAVPALLVASILKECGKKGIKAVIVISAGFAELNKKGREMQDKLLQIAKKYDIRVVGPNCLGVIRPANSLNASFAPAMPPKGNVAFISQSGALADSIIDWAIEERYGFSAIISYGNRADLDVCDFLRLLEKDKETKVIAIYIEGLADGREFIDVAKKIKKPIIALKAGKTAKGEKAIQSHTGSLAGDFAVYEAAFKQAGVIIADTVEDMFDMAKALAHLPKCKNSIAIVTNGGGPGVLTADYCTQYGIKLAKLTEKTIKTLDKSRKMHPAYSRKNPLDIVGDALPDRYAIAINTLLKQKDIYGLIVIQTLQTMTDPLADAKVIVKAKKRFPSKPVITSYLGGRFGEKGRLYLEMHSIPDYNDVKKAAKAMSVLVLK